MGQGWAVTVPLIIGPDDQVSYLQQALSQRGTGADPTILAEFNKIEQIIVDSDQEFKLLLTVNGKKDQLTLTCSDQIELDNLADLIDGYCRGARSDMNGTIVVQANKRKLPEVPSDYFHSIDKINMAHTDSNTNTTDTNQMIDDAFFDYAEIGDSFEEPKFDPKFELIREDLEIMGPPIGRGQFGNVHQASFVRNGIKASVAVKSSNFQEESADIGDRFIEEAQIMAQFSHAHIVELVGVCTTKWPILIVMELCALGCLKDYLQKNEANLEQIDLINYVNQLSSALSYLDSQSFVHRDIAVRNLLLTNKETVKLGDFGLSRKMDENDSYYVASKGKLPIKWMAPESINFRKFTAASDVWMFGVCSWEILSCGIKPFSKVKNNDVIGKIEEGIRLKQPEKCPYVLYKIFEHCWMYDPTERPTAAQLHEDIVQLLQDLETGNENNLYIVNNHPTKKHQLPKDPNNLEILPPSLLRNPTIPPKKFPREVTELEAEKGLEYLEKRNSNILNEIDRQETEQRNNQRWLAGQISSLTRSGSLGSNRSLKSGVSAKSEATSLGKPVAPAKPPRSTRSSSSSSSIKESKNLILVQDEKSENPVFEQEDPYTTIAAHSSGSSTRDTINEDTIPSKRDTIIQPLMEEMPKIQLKDVILDKTMRLDRTNDPVFESTKNIIVELTKLKNYCDNNDPPDQLVSQIRFVAVSCKKLEQEVTIFSRELSEDMARDIDLEKRSVFAELKQVVTQLNNVKSFDGTRTAAEYRKVLLSAILVMAFATKNLQDTIDKARIVLSQKTILT